MSGGVNCCDLFDFASNLALEECRVALQIKRPPGLVVDSVAHGLPSDAVAMQVTVLQLHACALGRLREEPHFDLAREIRVALDLPPGADVPAEDDAVRGLERKDARPT